MHRSIRLFIAVLALLAVAGGTALAARQTGVDDSRAPLAASHEASPAANEADEADEPMTEEAAAALVERLAGAGLETDAATLTALAADHGVGGAVRLLGWAQEKELDVAFIADMRADGMGWGQIAKELDVHPGIGKWMRGAHEPGGDADDAGDEAGALGQGGPHGLPDQARGNGRANAPGQANRP